MPNRSRSGPESMPLRVVAPMIVNFFRGRLIVRADIPSPSTTSTRKSSMTG